MDVKGKVVLITGASAGIGLATARLFATQGARLALVARSTDRLARIAEEMGAQGVEAIALPADVRDEAQVTRVVQETAQHFGRLDVLINNAGQAAAGAIADVDPDHFRQIVELNVFGPLYAMQAAIPVMRAQGGGIIVNISSMISKMNIPGLGTYAATKAALNLLSNTARGELAADHIRVITVYPRTTATEFGAHSLGNREMRRRQRQHGEAVRVDTAEYVAGRILAAVQSEVAEQYMEE